MARKRSLIAVFLVLVAGSIGVPGFGGRWGQSAVPALATGAARPDLIIGSGAARQTIYRGDNVYRSSPSEEQADRQTTMPGTPVAYEMHVQNDGPLARRFVLAAAESADPGWEIAYTADGVSITEQICGPSGYVTGEILPGASEAITLVLIPGAGATAGSSAGSVVQVSLGDEGADPLDVVAAAAALEPDAAPASSRALAQADLLIKGADEPASLLALDDVYQAAPAGRQIEWHSVGRGGVAKCDVVIENDGTSSRTYALKAAEGLDPGWAVVYKLGLTDISAAMRSSAGFTTAVLSPGASTSILVEVRATSAYGGTIGHATVNAFTSGSDTTVDDSVRLSAFIVANDRPDLQIKDLSEPSSAFAINDTYQTTPSGDQIETQAVSNGATASYSIHVGNDGNRPISYALKAVPGAGSGWTVVYKSGASDVTSQILSSTGFATPVLPPGSGTVLLVQMTPSAAVFGGSTRSALVRAYLSSSDTTVRDSVSAVTSVPVVEKADLQIKAAAQPNTSFALDDIYQTSPAGEQIEAQTVAGGYRAIYHVRLQNDGNQRRTFVLKAAESAGTGRSISYRAGATTITAAILGASGYTSPVLPPGGTHVITVDIVPGAAVRGGSSKSVTIRAFLSSGDTPVRDSVRAQASVPTITRADLLIKDSFEASSAFAANNVYQSTPSGSQIEPQLVNAGNKARFSILLQNDGNTTRSFVLKAVESAGADWTVVYKAGATDVTTAILGAGYTTPLLSPGVSHLLNVEITAGATLPGGSIKRAIVSALLTSGDTTAGDAVEARAAVDRPGRPDLLIKRAQEPESDFALDNVYQTTPSGLQIESQSTAVGTAGVCHVRLQNDGPSTRGFVLRAIESSTAGWITSYQIGTSDVTAAMRGSGGHLVLLPAGGFTTVVVSMTPTASAPVGVTKQSLVRVHLNETDTVVRDSVRAAAVPE